MKAKILLFVLTLFLVLPNASRAAFVPHPVGITAAAPESPAPAPEAAAHHRGFWNKFTSHFKLPFDKRNNAQSDSNGWAIASFCCGVVGLFILGIPLGVCAVVFGALGMSNQKRLRGLAIAGLVLGVIDIVGALIVISMMAK
jgi:hypothetical protein